MMAARTLAELLGLHAWIFALLLLPGLACVSVFGRGRKLAAEALLACALCASGSVALVVFYLTVLSPLAGRAASWLVMGLGVAGVALRFRHLGARLDWRPLVPPLLLCLFAGIFYSSILFLYGGFDSASEVAMKRYLPFLPADSVIPLRLAERLASGGTLHPFFGDWLSSDRPPLQAAFTLMIWPFVPTGSGYQIMATILQTWAFLAVWLFLRLARVPARASAWALSFVVFSGFTVLNATFVWPKLLPAAFLLIAAAYLLRGKPEPAAPPVAEHSENDDPHGIGHVLRFVLIGACAGIAMMGHGGSAFGVVALGIFAVIFQRRLISAKTAGVAIAAFFVFLLPWSAYQRLVDPPGNRLLKWHLAGVVPIDSRSFPEALEDSYRVLSVREWLHNKKENVRVLFTDDGPDLHTILKSAVDQARLGRFFEAIRDAAYWARIEIMFHIYQGLGVLNLGILALVFSTTHRRDSDATLTCAHNCLILGAIGTAIWCLLMFIPGSTVNHQGSYFINLCFMIAGALGLMGLPRWAIWSLGVLNGFLLVAIWAVAATRSESTAAMLSTLDPAMAVLLVIALIATLATVRGIGSRPKQ